MFIYLWERQRQSMSRGGEDREGDTELEAGSRLRAVGTEPDTGLEFPNGEIMTWAEVGCSTNWAPGSHQLGMFLKILPQSVHLSAVFSFSFLDNIPISESVLFVNYNLVDEPVSYF